MKTRVWFPALRAWMKLNLGPYFPPQPFRVLLGAALTALIASSLWFVGIGVGKLSVAIWTGIHTTVDAVQQYAAEFTKPQQEDVVKQPPKNQDEKSQSTKEPSIPSPAPKPVEAPTVQQRPTPPKSSASFSPVRGVIDPNALPYSEAGKLSLHDAVRQVDFALMQALNRLGGTHVDVVHVGSLQTEEGPMLQQRLRLYLGGSYRSILQIFVETLQAWTEKAILEVPQGSAWIEASAALSNPAKPFSATDALWLPGPFVRIRIGNVISHELYVTPLDPKTGPLPSSNTPKLTIIIDDMGTHVAPLKELMALNIPISVSILPYERNATSVAKMAHEAGLEVLVHQPMESIGKLSANDIPHTLTENMSPEKIAEVIKKSLSVVPWATGLNNHTGSKFTQNAKASRTVVEAAALSGLFILDSLTHSASTLHDEAEAFSLRAFKRDLFLDDGITTVRSVRHMLDRAEAIAKRTGEAIVIGHPKPETLAALKAWVGERDPSVAVVPLYYQK